MPDDPASTREQPPVAQTQSTFVPPPATETSPTFVPSPEVAARIATGAPGIRVPGFEVEGELGHGAFGVVYRAKQVGLNRTVALKMLVAGPYASPALRARFLIEAEAVAALEHPHIVRVFAYGEHDGFPYLAMEFLSGGTLANRIKHHAPLSPRHTAEIVRKVAGAVEHAHSRGIVHRDIKPLNVLLTAEGEPRLTDFGLAKLDRAGDNLTVTGQVLGTPAYMSPEQAAGKVREIGPVTDVYALGAVLYELLTGRPPFQGDSVAVVLQKVLTEEPERPRKHSPDIPRDLEGICLKCLEKEASKRYASAGAMVADLSSFLAGRPVGATRTGKLRRVTHWIRQKRVATAGFVLLLLGAGTGFAILGGAFERPRGERSERSAAPVKYEDGETVQLFNPTAQEPILGWRSQGTWHTDDAEGNVVLAGRGPVTRKFDPPPHFRVALSIDPRDAEAVEVFVATGGTTRWLIRLDQKKGTAAFGKRVGSGDFESVGAPVPLPKKEEKKRPYVVVAYERAGDRLTAWLQTAELGGTSAPGLTTTELRVDGIGAPIRIERADLTERIEQR